MKKLIILSAFIFISVKAQNNQLKFDGANDWINLNTIQEEFYATSNSFTIEFWMLADKDVNTSSIRTCMFGINEPAGENRLLIILGGANAQDGLLMIYPDGSWGANSVYTSTEVIGDGKCHHIAYTVNGSQGKVYIDGDLVDTHYATYSFTANDRFSLGQEWDNLTQSQFYNGTLDDLRIWDHVRTDAEIENNMNLELTGNEAGLIAYYNFNQGVAGGNNTGVTTLYDASPNSQHVTLSNFTLTGNQSNWLVGNCSNIELGVEENTSYTPFKIFPNPAKDNTNLSLDFNTEMEAQLKVVNAAGQILYDKKIQLITGTNTVELDCSGFLPGIYVISIIAGDQLFYSELRVVD